MTKCEAMTKKIDANRELLRIFPPESEEAKALRHDQVNLLTARMKLTIGEAQEIVEE